MIWLDRCPPGLREVPDYQVFQIHLRSCPACGSEISYHHRPGCPISPPKQRHVTLEHTHREPVLCHRCWSCGLVREVWVRHLPLPPCACGASGLPPDYAI